MTGIGFKFNHKKNKIKDLEDRVRYLTNELLYNKELIRILVDEPYSDKAKIIHEVVRDYYATKRWTGLVTEQHLGWICDSGNTLFKNVLKEYFKPSKS